MPVYEKRGDRPYDESPRGQSANVLWHDAQVIVRDLNTLRKENALGMGLSAPEMKLMHDHLLAAFRIQERGHPRTRPAAARRRPQARRKNGRFA
jgi:hypothetical protein